MSTISSNVPMLEDKQLKKLSANDDEHESRQKFRLDTLTFLHGYNYALKSYFWKLILLISVTLAVLSIILIIHERVKLSEMSEPRIISSIPFPALTICPETKTKKATIDITRGYLAISNNNDTMLNEDDLRNIEALSQVCDPHLFIKPISKKATSGKEFENILRTVSIDNFVLFCKFRNEMINCSEYFTEIVTSEGICKTFNFAKEDLMILPGVSYGLNIVLSLNRNDTDFICKGPVQGFKYKIHPSHEFPNFQHSFDRVPLKTDVTVEVEPKLTFNRDPSCSVESQNDCLRNCSASFLLSKCGCVSFHMPHDEETSICSQHENVCVSKAIDEFSTNITLSSEFLCNCRPSCESLKYEKSLNFAEYDFANVIRAYNEDLDGEFPSTDMSRLTIYFAENYVVPQIIGENCKMLSTIAEIGGILAFFFGASMLTIVEICYLLVEKSKNKYKSKYFIE